MLPASLSLLAESAGMQILLLSVGTVGSTKPTWHTKVHLTALDAPKGVTGADWYHSEAALYPFWKVIVAEVGSWWLGKGITCIQEEEGGSRELQVAQTHLSPWEDHGNLWDSIWGTMSHFGFPSARKALTYWIEFSGRLPKWLEDWSTRCVKRGWES